MKITNHLLTAPADTKTQSPNKGGVIKPTVIVLHYTASGGEDGQGDADYLSRASSRASAHVVVGRNGSIDQIVPFNLRAWHAGKSSYNGVKDVNDFSIGIEIDNLGWQTDKLKPEQIFTGQRDGKGYSKWEKYPQKQLDAVDAVITAIMAEYDITDIVGHEDIAPGRKTDPGPALDDFMAKMKAKHLKAAPAPKPADGTQRKKTTNALRLRAGPGTGYQVLTTVPKGHTLTITATLKSGWSQTSYGGKQGYVSTQYLVN